jgi:hypothetical protein
MSTFFFILPISNIDQHISKKNNIVKHFIYACQFIMKIVQSTNIVSIFIDKKIGIYLEFSASVWVVLLSPGDAVKLCLSSEVAVITGIHISAVHSRETLLEDRQPWWMISSHQHHPILLIIYPTP